MKTGIIHFGSFLSFSAQAANKPAHRPATAAADTSQQTPQAQPSHADRHHGPGARTAKCRFFAGIPARLFHGLHADFHAANRGDGLKRGAAFERG